MPNKRESCQRSAATCFRAPTIHETRRIHGAEIDRPSASGTVGRVSPRKVSRPENAGHFGGQPYKRQRR